MKFGVGTVLCKARNYHTFEFCTVLGNNVNDTRTDEVVAESIDAT